MARPSASTSAVFLSTRSPPGDSCTVDSASNSILNCQLADVAAGASTRIVVHARPDQGRIANGLVQLNLQNDSDATNNSATFSVTVSEEPRCAFVLRRKSCAPWWARLTS